ncbi:LysR family transcriptional regulator [Adlercreutzia sp. R21]|uniref:LysR family transcriptional regulator n=1 Tax=Adlercreutzia wanghongyangiae TaxID=3111451 RepID=UPI002DBB32A2|nr:LysR family transcriptional regulator [Adlercreutzia sp. R21]MEC4183462.1 LysR family transcriptional regulator [Adlercreutzia sp. R21]
MNIDTLQKFVALVRHMNYTTASRELHITQPGLSKSISELEKELGVKLFRREGELELTPAGEFCLERAEEIVYQRTLMENGCRQLANSDDTALRIAYPYGVDKTYDAILAAYRHVRSRHPYVPIRFSSQDRVPLLQKLTQNKVDVGTVILFQGDLDCFSAEEGGEFQLELLCADAPELWVPLDHPLSKKESIELEDIEKIPLFVGQAPPFELFRTTLESFASSYGLTLRMLPKAVNSLEEFVIAAEGSNAGLLLASRGVGEARGHEKPAMTMKASFALPITSYHYFIYRKGDANPLLREYMDEVKNQMMRAGE